MKLKPRNFHIGRFEIGAADAAALLVFALMCVLLFMTAPYGVTEADEPLYQVYEQRLMKGDRLFYDDWTLTPFSTIFNFLPFAAFYHLSSGAEGSLLALRYFFVFLKLFAFCAVYLSLRKHGRWAVLAACVFTGAFAFGIKTLNYYFVCGCALLFTGMVLFVKKQNSPFSVAAAGFVFSLAVLAEPSIAAIWIIYTLIVIVRAAVKKKNPGTKGRYDFVLSFSVWKNFLFGVLIAAGALFVLCAAFFMRAPLDGLRQGFMNALNDPERSNGFVELLKVRLNMISLYAGFFHPSRFWSFIALLPVFIIVGRFKKKAAPVFFIILTVLYAAMTLRLLFYPMSEVGFAVGETICHPLPLCLLALCAYSYTRHKNERLFAFLLFGFAASVFGDIISMTAFGAFSEVTAVPAVLIIRDYYLELKEDLPSGEKNVSLKKNGKKASSFKTFSAALTVLFVFACAAEAAHFAYIINLHETERLFVKSEEPLDSAIGSGAFKGIITTREIAENYEKSVRDCAIISKLCENRLYVADLAPSVYLDSDELIAAHSPYYYYQEGWDRVSAWWEMHPEKRPDVIYIPYIKLSYLDYPDSTVDEKLDWLSERAEIEVTNGEAGAVVKILAWREH